VFFELSEWTKEEDEQLADEGVGRQHGVVFGVGDGIAAGLHFVGLGNHALLVVKIHPVFRHCENDAVCVRDNVRLVLDVFPLEPELRIRRLQLQLEHAFLQRILVHLFAQNLRVLPRRLWVFYAYQERFIHTALAPF